MKRGAEVDVAALLRPVFDADVCVDGRLDDPVAVADVVEVIIERPNAAGKKVERRAQRSVEVDFFGRLRVDHEHGGNLIADDAEGRVARKVPVGNF